MFLHESETNPSNVFAKINHQKTSSSIIEFQKKNYFIQRDNLSVIINS